MKDIVDIGIAAAAAIVLAVIEGNGLVYVFNRLPAKWLCDYGEEPSEQLLDTSRQRIKSHPWKPMLTALFFAVNLYIGALSGHDVAYMLPVTVCIWLLLMIAAADGKYSIIPDQLLVFLMLMSAAFVPFGAELRPMLAGAGVGAGLMLAVAVAGYFVSGRESLGFGDVKLMAAVGLISGFYGCILIMAAGSLAAGLWFMSGMLRGKLKSGDMKPLGPFLAGAAIFYLLVF